MAARTITVQFLVVSDTHNLELQECGKEFWQPLPKVDVVLHCGDLTHCGGSSSYKKALKMLGDLDAELKLVMAGNHDLDLDKDFWVTHLDEGDEVEDYDRALETMTGPLATEAGVTYLEEGTHTFTLKNGASFTVYTSPYSLECNGWAFAYEPDEDRFNLAVDVSEGVTSIAKSPIPPNVDIIMTHGPPRGILDKCPQGNVGCPNVLQAIRRVRPLLHCFGHIHEANGAVLMDWTTGEHEHLNVPNLSISQVTNTSPKLIECSISSNRDQTLMLNAAIMDAKNRPVNAPWVIELQLDHAKLLTA